MSFESDKEFYEYAKQSLSNSDKEAANRFKQYKSNDPFPDIQPALLNSADIFKYVAATGMIYPFYPEKLKGASYSVKLKGECRYWDEDGKEWRTNLERKHDKFVLKRNSLAYITLEPQIRIPDYLAIRFNLKISHVYKGLLLGTGPLVDPGFEGRLSIPLHNFTSNMYEFYGDQDLIWIEFTKLSHNSLWAPAGAQIPEEWRELHGHYFKFPDNKKNMNIEHYIRNALEDAKSKDKPPCLINFSVRNAIPEEVRGVENKVNRATEVAENAKNIVYRLGYIAIISLAFTIYSLIFQLILPTQSMINDTVNYLKDSQKELSDSKQKIAEMDREIKDLKAQIEKLLSK